VEQQRDRDPKHDLGRDRDHGEVERAPERRLEIGIGHGIDEIVEPDPGGGGRSAGQARISEAEPDSVEERVTGDPNDDEKERRQHEPGNLDASSPRQHADRSLKAGSSATVPISAGVMPPSPPRPLPAPGSPARAAPSESVFAGSPTAPGRRRWSGADT